MDIMDNNLRSSRIKACACLTNFLITNNIPFEFTDIDDTVLIFAGMTCDEFIEEFKSDKSCKMLTGKFFELTDGVEDCFYEITDSPFRTRGQAIDIRVDFRNL